jgi:uncharacterized membrane protein
VFSPPSEPLVLVLLSTRQWATVQNTCYKVRSIITIISMITMIIITVVVVVVAITIMTIIITSTSIVVSQHHTGLPLCFPGGPFHAQLSG